MKMATGKVEETKAGKMLKQIKADLEATHTRLLFAMEAAAGETSGLVVQGEILKRLEGIAKATRYTEAAMAEIEQILPTK